MVKICVMLDSTYHQDGALVNMIYKGKQRGLNLLEKIYHFCQTQDNAWVNGGNDSSLKIVGAVPNELRNVWSGDLISIGEELDGLWVQQVYRIDPIGFTSVSERKTKLGGYYGGSVL